MAEGNHLKVERRKTGYGIDRVVHRACKRTARRQQFTEAVLHSIARENNASFREQECGTAGRVSGHVHNLHAAEDREAVTIDEPDIDARGTGIEDSHYGVGDSRDSRVDEWITEAAGSDLGGITHVDGDRRRAHCLDLGQGPDVVQVRVGEDDLADIVHREPEVIQGAGKDRSRPWRANIDDRHIATINGHVGAATASTNAIEPGRDLFETAPRAAGKPGACVLTDIHGIERNAPSRRLRPAL